MPRPPIAKSYGDLVSNKGQQYIQRRVSRSSAECRFVRTVDPLAHFHGEVIVLANVCHDNVTVGLYAQVCLLNFVAIVFFCTTAVILLANWGELYESYSTVAWDLWQCKQTSSLGYAFRLGLFTAINPWHRAITIT